MEAHIVSQDLASASPVKKEVVEQEEESGEVEPRSAPLGLAGLVESSSSSSTLPKLGAGGDVNEGPCSKPAHKDQDTSSCHPPLQAAPSLACTEADLEDSIVKGVGLALTHMASLTAQPERLTCFHSKFAPNISIGDFLLRLRKFFRCTAECHVLSLIYVDRLLKIHKDFALSNLTCHRLIIASTVLAAKFHDDKFYSNKQYAKVSGVSLMEMNRLELNFLQLIDWKLNVPQEEYDIYLDLVLKAAAQEVSPES
jgi:hypothetical protein